MADPNDVIFYTILEANRVRSGGPMATPLDLSRLDTSRLRELHAIISEATESASSPADAGRFLQA